MLDFLFKKKKINKSELFNNLYSKIKQICLKEDISASRRTELSFLIEKYGYLPYSYSKALQELTCEEVIFCLEKKLELTGSFKDGRLFAKEISAVKRSGFSNSDWIKKEQHDIKLINLPALSANKSVKFIDWLRQIVILPCGNLKKNILSTTIYLVPFTLRDFSNAYISAGLEEINPKLEDKELKAFNISLKEQIKLFITLAQLASHPVIYDVLPQCGRFSKTVLANPFLVRWIDVNFIIEEISKSLNSVALKLSKEFDEDDVTIVKNIYKTTLKSGSVDLSSEFMPIYNRFSEELTQIRKDLSCYITTHEQQKKLQERVKKIISCVEGVNSKQIKSEKDITKRGEIINALINEGLWTLPIGSWCSSGISVFEKMSEGGAYPIFRNYNTDGDDVSEFNQADCETPFYFSFLETGELNLPVVNFYIDYLKNLQNEYNFDGFRISNTDFIVDRMSEKDLKPISCRIPRVLIAKINETMKKQTPYFASIAEYRLWNDYFKEYHENMKFDLLWGNDTKTDYEKTPAQVIEDNRKLQNYNGSFTSKEQLSILKTYNNQDGEFRTINRYIGLIDKDEALFKWFKFKFLPSGKLAQRPVLYCDGDEDFSLCGIEKTIQEEVSLLRAQDEDFYLKFDAIRRFAINNELTLEGEAQIINNSENGFISWIISKETSKESLIIAANFYPKHEKILIKKNGIPDYEIKIHEPIKNKKIQLPGDFNLISEFIWNDTEKDFIEHRITQNTQTIKIEKLEPSEFHIYKVKRL